MTIARKVRKVKISISLDADLLGIVDRRAAEEGATRSAVMELWLRQASHRSKLARLEEETARYYEALTDVEREEDAALAAASSRAARKLRIDEPQSEAGASRRGRSRRRA
jgi:metal-responsive CopG/Arc/MetJ family transcriptional regulator